MPQHKVTLPLGAVKLIHHTVAATDMNLSVSQFIAKLALEGTDLLTNDGELGIHVPQPAPMLSNAALPTQRPTAARTYISAMLRLRIADLAHHHKVPADIAFWRSLIVGALCYRFGGPVTYLEKVREAMEAVGDANMRFVSGDPAPPPFGMPRRHTGGFRQKREDLGVTSQVLRIPLPVQLAMLLRKAASKLDHGNISVMVRRLLTNGLQRAATLTIADIRGNGEMNFIQDNPQFDGVSVLLPVDLVNKYDIISSTIAQRHRSKLMRHILATQLRIELTSPASTPTADPDEVKLDQPLPPHLQALMPMQPTHN
jgi:hypothetical protein